MAKDVMLKAKGLFTFQNFLSEIPEGSLLDATNVVIDRDGIVEPRRGITEYGSFGDLDDRAKQLLNYKNRVLVHYGSTLAYDNGIGTFADFTDSFSDVASGLRIKAIELNGNFYVTTSEGIKKIAANSSNLAAAIVSDAGGIKALDGRAVVDYSTPGFFTGLSKVAYRVIWGITDVNDNAIYGSPSSRIVVTNFSAASGTVDLTFAVPDGVNTNYYYQVYRTSVFTAGGLVGLDEIDPGDEMRLVIEDFVTAGQIAVKEVTLSDITPDDFQAGGAPLYTNPNTGDGGRGILDANEPPPVAHDIAVFKNSAFYSNTRSKHSRQLSLLSVSGFQSQSQAISAASLGGTTLTVTSNGHGMTNGQLVAVVIPNSNVTFLPANVNTTTEFITITGHGLTTGQVIRFTSSGSLPTGLVAGTDYYVLGATANTFQVSATFGGTAVNLSTQGTGTHSVAGFVINNVYTVANAAANTFDITVPANTVIVNVEAAYLFKAYVTVTDGSTTNRYFFVGRPEITDITFDTQTNTTDGSWFELSAAGNTVRYVIWFNKTGSTLPPLTPGKVQIEVDISAIGGATNVSPTVLSAIEATTNDFAVTQSSPTVLNFTTATNGFAADAAAGTTPPGGTFAIDINGQGYGESVPKKFVTLSGYLSVAQAVDETARSFVQVISRNTSEIIYGYYISGPDDIPGMMNFERRELIDSSFSFTGNNSTTGSMFNPDITTAVSSSDEEFPNRIYFSKYQQPEAVPVVNFIDIGPKDKAILRIVPLRDSLFIFKEDAIYRLTGDVSPNFSVILFDNSVKLIAPDSCGILNNQIYCLTDGGIATVTETGVGIISRPIENVFNRITTDNFPGFSTASFGIGYETERSYFIWTVTNMSDTTATQAFRYNTFTRCWTRWDREQRCIVLNSDDNKMYLGATDSNFVEVERKSLTRLDYADNQFDLSINADAIVDENTIEISNASQLEEGDAVVQTQYVTTHQFNTLLLKLDADPRIALTPGTYDTDYHATLEFIRGDSMTNKMTALVAKLNTDPGTDGGYAFSGATDFATIQTEYNVMIADMNTDTKLKFDNYQSSVGTVAFEMTIEAVDRNHSTIDSEVIPVFMVGPVTIYKGIRTSIVWAPSTMGDPSALKHVREATMLFEASTFRGATVSYNTDLSPGFEPIDFIMDGNGTWGGFFWGENNWGGGGSGVPFRTYIPRQKQRCRYIRTKFEHNDAFYKFSILGTSYVFEVNSDRAYRGKT